MSATYLEGILAWHRAAACRDPRTLEAALQAARAVAEPARGFTATLARRAETDGLAVIAELKRRSPSRGDLFPDLDPALLARQYEKGGAACLSVLTDAEFFGGSSADLRAARAAVGAPVLRKDFTLSARDVCDTRTMGADAVLLIVAALEDAALSELRSLAAELGLDAVVEVHDERELDRALAAGATCVGVNQRDLTTFEVDHRRAARLAHAIPDGVVRVAESGIRGPADAAALADCGFHAVLVGESLLTGGDPAGGVAALAAAAR